MSKPTNFFEPAQKLSASAETWADLSNALFDPDNGILAKAFPTRAARAAFTGSEEYKQIRQLVRDAMTRTGAVAGAAPTKSGRFVIRLPRSLHAALEREAKEEGVSLNQLVVAKLAVQLSSLSSGRQK